MNERDLKTNQSEKGASLLSESTAYRTVAKLSSCLYLTRSRMRGFTFSPNAIGVGANVGAVLIAPTPMALGLNVSHQAA